MLKKIVILPLIISLCFSLLYSSEINEYTKASQYLEQGGEVYFSFTINSKSDISRLSSVVSIDRVLGSQVYAYANKEELQKFLEYDFYYEVLTHPGDLLKNPQMYYGKPGESFEWDKYPIYDEYINMMNQFETDYPELCKIHEIGETHNGRKILVAKVSDHVNDIENEPGFLSASTMHGDETAGYMLMLRMIDYLLTNYGQDARVTRIVDSIEMWINPNINLDGTYSGGNSTVFGARRGNANNIDINRNFPNHIGGAHPDGNVYQKETEACIQFESQHNLVMGADLHGGIECALTPWACQFEKPLDNYWFLLIARQYADLAQANSPTGYFTGSTNGVGNGAEGLYTAEGIRLDWQLHYNHCRGLTIEMSNTKILPENQLNSLWDYNKDALLSFYEQVLNGIRGIVTDSITGEPLAAKVFIENLDKDSNHVYSHLPHGGYYRPIYRGTYEVTFSCKDYYPKTVGSVAVENHEATILDVRLLSSVTGSHNYYTKNNAPPISIISNNRSIKIICKEDTRIKKIALYSLNGRVIKTFTPQLTSYQKSIVLNGLTHVGNGCYIVQVQATKQSYSQRIMFSQ